MQALWSRVAQTRSSCRCRSCLNATAVVTRRTTTATRKRGVKVGDLFTACYSTILATAVFADARVKEDRRKEWDRVIAEAKAGNYETATPKSTQGQQKAERLNFRIVKYLGSDNLGSWSSTSWKPPMHRYESRSASLARLDNELRWLADTSPENLPVTEETPPSSPGQNEEWYDQDDIEALPSEYFTPREPLKSEYKDKVAEMVRNLVDQLLLRTNVFSIARAGPTSASSDVDIQKIQIAQRIKELQATFIQMPAYSEGEISQEQRTALHKSLSVACTSTNPDRSNVELLVAKICYNLLISTTPPNIGTYNILIREFTRLRQHELAQDVIDSFHQSKMKPNNRTIQLMLDHFIAWHSPIGFQQTIDRMSVAKGDMSIKRRRVYKLTSDDLQWATTNRVRFNGIWVSQKVDRSPDIFEALIRGSFELKGVRPAIRVIKASLREGQMLRARTFYNAVEACLSRLDSKAARNLLGVILSTWKRASILLADLGPDFRYAFHRLLVLCNIDWAPDSKPNLPPFLSPHTLRDFIRWLRIETLEDSISRHKAFVSSLRTTVERIQPQFHETFERVQPQFHEILKAGAHPTFVSSCSKVWSDNEFGTNQARQAEVRDPAIWEALDRLEMFEEFERIQEARRNRRIVTNQFIRLLQFWQTEIDNMATFIAGVSQEVEAYRIRQSPSSQIRAIEAIEAELAIQVHSLALAGYNVVPLFLDQLSNENWNKFITSVRKVHSMRLSFNDPLKYVLRLISGDNARTEEGQQHCLSSHRLEENTKSTKDGVETHEPKPSTHMERPAEWHPFPPLQHQHPLFADL